MKYFTPDLLERVGSLDDEIADAAHEEWERALVRCRRRWQKIKAAFPRAVQRFEAESVCLHDAQVLSMGRQGYTFVIVLKMEPPSDEMVLLTFDLAGDPRIDPTAVAGHGDDHFVTWMYEEWDLDRNQKCQLEVLLSNGWSVRLPFRDFQYLVGRDLLATRNGPAAAVRAAGARSA
jgi:hypothetical protein